MATLYDALGVPPHASNADLRRAHHDLVRSLHPDRHGGVSPDPTRLHDVNEAWRVLRTPEGRAAYDRSLAAAPRRGAEPGRERREPLLDDDDLDAPIRSPLAHPGDVGITVVRGLPWIAVAIVLGIIFVFTAFAGGGGSGSDARSLLGRCVDQVPGDGLQAVPCDGPNDGEVVLVVDRATRCPSDTVPTSRDDEWLCVAPAGRDGP